MEEAAGRVAAAAIGGYPPGCALLMPGELIEALHVETLCALRAAGGQLFGVSDGLVCILNEKDNERYAL